MRRTLLLSPSRPADLSSISSEPMANSNSSTPTNTPDSPLQEVRERLAGPGVGLAMAGRVVGLENHRRILADAARRTQEGHRAMARAAGMEDVVGEKADDMGHLIVTGDINVQPREDGTMPRMPWDVDHPPQVPTEPPASRMDRPRLPTWLKVAALLAAGGATGGGAVALPSAIDWLIPDTPATQPADPSLDPGGLTIEPIRGVEP